MKDVFLYLGIAFVVLFMAWEVIVKVVQVKQRKYYNQKLLTFIIFLFCLAGFIAMLIGYLFS